MQLKAFACVSRCERVGTFLEFVHMLGHLLQEFREREINNGRQDI